MDVVLTSTLDSEVLFYQGSLKEKAEDNICWVCAVTGL